MGKLIIILLKLRPRGEIMQLIFDASVSPIYRGASHFSL